MTEGRMPTLTVPVPSRESSRAKAMRLLLEGRVRVRLVKRGRVWCEVRGDSGKTYAVSFTNGRWACTCEGRGADCSHIRACWFVITESTP